MSKNKDPERIELSNEQIQQLEEKLRTNNLSSSDQELILKLIKWARWVDSALKLKGLSLKRLRRIIFGDKTEKPASDKNKDPKDPPSKTNQILPVLRMEAAAKEERLLPVISLALTVKSTSTNHCLQGELSRLR